MDHWLELLLERQKISQETFNDFKSIHKELQIRLNNFISQNKNEKEKSNEDE